MKFKLLAILCAIFGVVNTIAFVISPQPYGVYGFLFFGCAAYLWAES